MSKKKKPFKKIPFGTVCLNCAGEEETKSEPYCVDCEKIISVNMKKGYVKCKGFGREA